ncbi:hypothetical protein BWQ96_03072 [Gracilariopsis chorda]|uniref:Uncharacterized protein n=1 Tax=Gracilariopsis chorda TaxID=448386 RepID=A0A2V3J171_9FLOR|nr:hypothetical protein BWQ96_03072 [Gracilariopsis chorda]|eukprot:PXF47130.1 hypothetical protein BWQ96_03072 [Gracilariopsis chorda]
MLRQCLEVAIGLYANLLFMGRGPRATGTKEVPADAFDHPMLIFKEYEVKPKPVTEFIATVRRSYGSNDGKIRKRRFIRRLKRFSWFRNSTIMFQKEPKTQPPRIDNQCAKRSSDEKSVASDSAFWLDRRPFIQKSRSASQHNDARGRARVQPYNPDMEAARRAWMMQELDKSEAKRHKVWTTLPFPLTKALGIGHWEDRGE